MRDPQEYLDTIIQSISDPIFVKDREHRWVFVNNAFCRFMGYPRVQIIGKSDYDYFPHEQADVFWQKDEEVFASGQENVNEEKLTDAEGQLHTIITKKTRYSDHEGSQFIVGIIRDVTDLRQIQKNAAQAQKTEALAGLAGNVAHDMNNQLTPVIGYLDLVLHELPSSMPARKLVEEARAAALRCAETVERLRDVGRNSLETPTGVPASAPKGHEWILLADDEAAVLELGRAMLERLGYRVLVATDGDDAVERYRSTPGISLVILDVVMPRMGGQQALQKILEVDPAARVLISSGYMMNSKPEDFIRNGAKGFLKKPYLLESLAQLVRQTIDYHA
jgi:PAS domain S-box-containing protein